MEWYAVSTQPHKEALAERNLKSLGVETFAPRIRQEKVIRRRWQTVIRPLFAGYLFARFSIGTHYRAVNYARGVRGVVTFGSVPGRVDDAIIESIRSRLHDGCVLVRLPTFTLGQSVRIEAGPLEGLEAIFERETSDHQRVVLLLKTLSYQARVAVAPKHVVGL